MIPPWSYTLLSDFANCPHKAWRKSIKKDLPREEKSPEQLHGIEVHKNFELWINNGIPREAAKPHARFVEPMIAAGARAEVKLGMREDGSGCDFWAKDVWGRGVADVVIINGGASGVEVRRVALFDWKTGKEREDPRELQIQAMLLKASHPEIERATGAYVWLKEAKLGQVHDISTFDRCLNGTRAAVAEMKRCDAEGRWPKTPNALCGWCPVKDCEHNRS